VISGLKCVGRALGLIRRRPRLLLFLMMAPWTLNLVVFLGSWSLLTLYLTSRVGPYLDAFMDAWWTPLLTGFGYFVAVVAAGALAYGITVIGAVLIAAPFLDRLSFEAERAAHPDRPPPPARLGMLASLKEGAKTALALLALEAALLPVNLVPAAGVPLFALASAWVLTLGLLDVPLARRGLTLGEKGRFVRRQFGGVLGVAVAVLAVSPVPFLNLLAVPVLVVAATLLVAGAEDAAPAPSAPAPAPAAPGDGARATPP